MNRIEKILEIAGLIAGLTGNELAEKLAELAALSAHEYQALTGKPIDLSLVPYIERIP